VSGPSACWFFEPLIILGLALLIDQVFGEPPDPVHPTVWMGKVIAFLKARLRNKNLRFEKVNGVLLCVISVAIFTVPVCLVLFMVKHFLGFFAYVVLAAVILKLTFALKGMAYYTIPIAKAMEKGDLENARRWLRFVVRRKTENLDRKHLISAAVESIAESTVDGVTSSLFHFALFGVPGAVAFRVISTLDSMVGYKDPEHINLGWSSARLDTIANYIPARLTALLMVLAALLLQKDWRSALRIMIRDRTKTESFNAGWPMATMAGALNVQLEKLGRYVLGDMVIELTPAHILAALKIMKVTSILFCLFVVVPILAFLAFVLLPMLS
jgi:adenosylcobinamide-phosphate synthase